MASHLDIGILMYPKMDQIDANGPFDVLARVPNSTVHILWKDTKPFRDMNGLILTPEKTLAEAPPLDVLVVPGGFGQEALMDDEEVLSFIRRHVESGGWLFAVCTGALVCGAAGILRERRATTHWASTQLLPYFGATVEDSRVVVDGKIVTAGGVTAGIDGALRVVSLLRDDATAQRIQLEIEYAPDPPFQSGTPKTAPAQVLHEALAARRAVTEARLATAQRVASRLGTLQS